MFDRLFLAHPRSVGESYFRHLSMALGFGARMIAAGAACVIHAFVPCLFTRTGSGTIEALHSRMQARQAGPAEPEAPEGRFELG